MPSIKQPEPVRILVATAAILVLIDVFAFKINMTFGVILLPFAFIGVVISIVRIAAPWYIKNKALKYLKKQGGRVEYEQLVTYLTPYSRKNPDPEAGREVIRTFLEGMEEDQIIQVQPDGTVVKARWGGRVP